MAMADYVNIYKYLVKREGNEELTDKQKELKDSIRLLLIQELEELEMKSLDSKLTGEDIIVLDSIRNVLFPKPALKRA